MSSKIAIYASIACGVSLLAAWIFQRRKQTGNNRRWKRNASGISDQGAVSLIGNTPVIRIRSLSDALGCEILAKCEFLNPGGSPKDRIAVAIIEDAERRGCIRPHQGYTIYEGTVGSTGIALAWICRAKGYQCHICIPDDQAQEKYQLLERLGAKVEKVRPVSIVDRNQFCNLARTRAEEDPRGYFADQFENLANFVAHFENTGPEIWEQTGGRLDVLILGAGTGGTLAGCARYLKPKLPELQVILADPQGSGLYNKVLQGVLYASTESEGTRRRHQVDTIVEGVGNNRMTTNMDLIFGRAQCIRDSSTAVEYLTQQTSLMESVSVMDQKWVDHAVHVTDREAVWMARYMVHQEGLFLGSSSCINLVAAVKTAQRWDQVRNRVPIILTILCDSGQRHLTKFWNDDYLVQNEIFSREELTSLPLDNLDFLQ